MRCFNHTDREAIGTCKACSKGLCAECLVDLGHGLSCRGVHEATVESYRVMLERNTKMLDAAPTNSIVGPIFLIVLGVLFCTYGLYASRSAKDFTFILGCAFLIYGVIAFFRNRSTFSSRRGRAT
jgi:hypothetical protein